MIRTTSLFLALSLATTAQDEKPYDKSADPFLKGGNPPPEMVQPTPEQESEILKGVSVPEGFDLSLFAVPPSFNYPVFVAAAPNGDLYVSCDGNGAQGTAPDRGRIVRLRDTDGDGRADETTEFAKNLDAPRGLLWDHDRLYVVHPPNLSAFIDADGDGVSEKQEVLVEGIGWDYKGRPADHATNGLSLGIDGYLYIAVGDFAIMKATGSDGTTLQHRSGSVIRVRPDGSGLEIYATGTRNTLEVAISPEMEMFTRDNTNDGGGWNVRFHHFTGLTDHGYPRLYKNFSDEIIQPVADYSGGSGCGAVYIDEPGFGEWNNAPFTADWGTGALYRHSLKPKSATFIETEAPQPFIKLYRPTDADVDAMSRVYLASWKGATFNWEGPDVGFIVQVKPKGFTPEPLPDFTKASNADLVKLCESESYRRRIEAQRELIRRGLPDEAIPALTALAADPSKPIAARATALFAFTRFPEKGKALYAAIKDLKPSPAFDVLVARATAENAEWVAKKHKGSFSIPAHWKNQPATLVQLNRLVSQTDLWNGETRRSIFNLTLGNSDPRVRHTAIQALAWLGDHETALNYVSGENAIAGHDGSPLESADALSALARMHKPEVVDGLTALLKSDGLAAQRKGILAALARLHFHEGEWKGDSWGTRPDTRGPYYQPEPWAETDKILTTLKEILAGSEPDEAAFLVSEMNRNRIQSNDALLRILALAKADEKLIPEATNQLATAEDIPVDAVPLLIKAAKTDPKGMEPNAAATLLANAVTALVKTDNPEGAIASLQAMVSLQDIFGSERQQDAVRNIFFNSQKLENHHQILEEEAEKMSGQLSIWSDAALLNLSARENGSPESRDLSSKALDHGWENPKRRVQILHAVARIKHNPYADKVLAALDDPDKGVAEAAKNAANALGIKKNTANDGPLIATMKNEEVIAKVMKTKGDPKLGEQLYVRASCTTCHTVSESEQQKGPYLGNIAQTYKRAELAEAILDPNKTVSQGFVTNVITTTDGQSTMGFVSFESAEKVTLRDITGKETPFATKDIKSRDKPPVSMMPPGLVSNLSIQEFASLLDYLEALAK